MGVLEKWFAEGFKSLSDKNFQSAFVWETCFLLYTSFDEVVFKGVW